MIRSLGLSPNINVRPVVASDVRAILRMVDQAWRMHLRLGPVSLGRNLKRLPGVVAEDNTGLRGFMLIEQQDEDMALIVAAGLRDTWSVPPYLDQLLPTIEQMARDEGLSILAHIGHDSWLVDGLKAHNFEVKEWIVSFERVGTDPPPPVGTPATIRTAHRNDLSTIIQLDTLAFDHLWHKSTGNFNEALANAGSFLVAEMDDQIVGYAWCDVYQQHAHLTRLGVHPTYQGLGIGAQLLHQSIQEVLALDVNWITLNTQEHNLRSQALYEGFGFVNNHYRMPVLSKDL
ncbi:MAG: GNAT family N-acetyltransferase [Chloroflexota bacterium]